MKRCPQVLSGLLLLLTAAAEAQIPATLIDTRVISVRADGKVDTVFTHAISSSTHSRVEQSGSMLGFPLTLKATAMIMSFGDSDLVFTLIDTTRKVYAEMKPKAMLAEAMGIAGAHMKIEATDDSLTVDSLGFGPVINGHKTLHFRTHRSFRLRTIIWSDTTVSNSTETGDYFLAPDIRDDDVTFTGDAIAPPRMDWVKDIVGPGLDSLTAHSKTRMNFFAKYGASMRSITSKSETSGAGTRITRQTIDVLRHETVSVPTSIFAAPAGYKKVAWIELTQMP